MNNNKCKLNSTSCRRLLLYSCINSLIFHWNKINRSFSTKIRETKVWISVFCFQQQILLFVLHYKAKSIFHYIDRFSWQHRSQLHFCYYLEQNSLEKNISKTFSQTKFRFNCALFSIVFVENFEGLIDQFENCFQFRFMNSHINSNNI